MDNLTIEQRKKNMRSIKSKDTKIEVLLRSALWSNGIRYRKNYKQVVGKPDIAIIKHKIAIFCDSSFWHGYDWVNQNKKIKSNREYWIKKIECNIHHDEVVNSLLKEQGWIVLRFWESQIENNIQECMQIVEDTIAKREEL